MDNNNEQEEYKTTIEWSRTDELNFIRIRKEEGTVTIEIGTIEGGPGPALGHLVMKAAVVMDVEAASEMGAALGDAAGGLTTCETCGLMFVARGNQKYCSKGCWPSTKVITLQWYTCPACGKRHQSRGAIYCSITCRKKGRRAPEDDVVG